MAVAQCSQGHYFDDEKFAQCPHCENELSANPKKGISDAKTMMGTSMHSIAAGAMRQKMRVEMGSANERVQDEKTIGIFRAEKGYNPVVGWLVCVCGKEKGRDFRLHVGRNYIGRALKNDIALVDDEQVSREDHCSVIFEPKGQSFHLVQGLGEGVDINGLRLDVSYILKGDDTIVLGGSEFVFIPFCKEGRSW